jgi:hypothetical protein
MLAAIPSVLWIVLAVLAALCMLFYLLRHR